MIKVSPVFGRLISRGFLPAWLVLALSMSATVLLWHIARSEVQSNARAYFDFRVEEIQQATRHRMRGYEQVLRGGVGLFAASEEVTRSEWREYVRSLRVEKNYPGIQGIGFSVLVPSSERERHNRKLRAEGLPEYAIWPEGDRPVYTAIIYLEPFDWRNQRAIGYDMYSEPVRRKAMVKAVDNDMTAISGKVTLVQETQKDIQAGFLMYLPFYRKGMPVSTAEERREALGGFVYSPFRMNDLMRGIIGRDIPDIDVEIFDGEAVSENSLMYDGDSVSHFAEKGFAIFRKSVKMELNGHTWTIQFSSLPPFEAAVYRGKPVNVFAAGSVISLLSFAIVFFMASHRVRLRAINDDLNAEVVERKRAEEKLRIAHDGLEMRVMERTVELTAANEALRKEISVRMQAEEALRESEERFRSLVETTNDWVWEMDGDFVYIYASPMVRDILGYEPEEMAGRTPFGHMAGEDAARFKEALTEFAASMKPFTFEIRCVRKDGSAAVLETSGAPIIGANGALLGYRGVDRDVTERKRIEQEKEKMHAQMLQSQKMELMGRLSAGVAHDFNNIMTIITSLNSLALREAGTGPLHDYLDQIQAASERASNLTRQLLIFSRSQPTKAEILDLNRAVDDMLRLLRHILGENILVTSELGPDPVFVQADKSNMEQLVMNLVLNSKDAMPGGGEIAIKTRGVVIDGNGTGMVTPELSPGDYACITVRDSGSGMDEETLARIFEPFFSTKAPGKGIGLGLTVVRNIVRECGGGIAVSSRPGEGAEFKVYLPASSERPKPSGAVASEAPQGRGERILIVEDEVMLSKSVSLVLSKNGYSVFAARDAEEVNRIFEKEQGNFQIVFSDVVLKGKSGVDIVDELLAVKPGLKVLFASGYMDIDSQWPYINEKGFRFLQKPYDIPELLRYIRECLDEE